MVNTFKLIVDYGKPYEEEVKDKAGLKAKLKELRVLADTGDYAYIDLDVEFNGRRLTEDELNKIEGIAI
jgi:hypothetical protein